MTFHDRRPPVRRPRRSNIPKDFRRLLDTADTAHEPSRNERLYEQAIELNADKLRDDETNARDSSSKIALANVFLRPFGVQFIANDCVLHIYEEWPGMDRRLISGSVWDGRAPQSTIAWEGVIRCAHENWKSAQRQLAAWRGMQFFRQGGMGSAWLDDGVGGVLRQIKAALALDRGAPVPLARQGGRESRSFLIEEQTGAVVGLGGATPQEKRLATVSKKKLNAEIMALRDNDRAFLRECRAYEGREVDLDELIGPRPTAHEVYVRHCLTSPRKKPIDIGSRGPAGDCFRFDPNNWIVTNQSGPRGCPIVVQIAFGPPIEIVPTRLHNDDTPQKLVAAFLAAGGKTIGEYFLWRDRLPAPRFPKWYVRQKLFVHQTARKTEIDKSNLFDSTRAGRDDCGAIFNPLGRGESKDKPIKNGYAGRSLRKELKAQGSNAKVIDIREHVGRYSYYAEIPPRERKPINTTWGNAPFDLPKQVRDRMRSRAPMPPGTDPWADYYTGSLGSPEGVQIVT